MWHGTDASDIQQWRRYTINLTCLLAELAFSWSRKPSGESTSRFRLDVADNEALRIDVSVYRHCADRSTDLVCLDVALELGDRPIGAHPELEVRSASIPKE